MSTLTHVVGVDCATQPGNVGVCLATHLNGTLVVYQVFTCSRIRPLAREASEWLRSASHAVIALDAPLGWPVSLARALADHEAGRPIKVSGNDMFSRATDRQIRELLGIVPLEVGANLIARTALAALKDLAQIGDLLGKRIPLAWKPGRPDGVVAIEVYPAATVQAHLKAGRVLAPPVGVAREVWEGGSHKRDAILCALAAADFIERRVLAPVMTSGGMPAGSVKREGWIWVADTQAVYPSALSVDSDAGAI